VPDVLGSTAQQAKASINTLGFKPKAESDWSKKKKGTVIDQKPAPGTEATEGTIVVYVVSDGYPTVPHWAHTSFGLSSATKLVKAKQLLRQRDLGLAGIAYQTHPVFSLYDLGEVFASTPKPGAKLRPGTQVTLVVAAPLACTPGYSACFRPYVVGGSLKDYDCPGGDGPYYASYTRVYGDDPYELDDDSDGVGCE
jgi:beta-lactam-binding protein with PASTA domain